MSLLENTQIKLRALEPEDIAFLYQTENDDFFWEVSDTQTPYSKYILKKYIKNSHQDIYEAKQLRFVIENKSTKKQIGMIDLSDFNPQHKRAGIGILILNEYQNKGYAKQAINILIQYAFSVLNLHQIFANIPSDNKNSIKLFEKLSFQKIGIKKEWIISKGNYKDVIMFQLINEDK